MLLLNKDYRSLKQAVAAADRFVTSPEFRATPFPLDYEPDSNGVEIDFKGVRYDTEVSDLTGGPWYQFSDEPETFTIPYLDKQIAKTTAQLPEAYIVPPEWTNVIDRLDWHSVEYTRLEEARTVTVASYRFSNVVWTQAPFEGHHTLTFDMDDIEQTRTYPAGSVVVSMHSDKARVIAHMLEPQGPDSYLFWGYFDTIFEQKEYAESYVMEKMAREMLASDPQLARDFEEMKQNTEGFAGNQRWIVNWFYTRSPYWDDRINVYPIGKIFDEDVLSSL